jgi:hypothetical protein
MKTSKLNELSKDVLNCNKCSELGLIEHTRKFLPDQKTVPNPILLFREFTSNEDLLANARLSDTVGIWIVHILKLNGLSNEDFAIFNTTLCTAMRSATSGVKTACRKLCQPNVKHIIDLYQPSVIGCFGKASNTLLKLNIKFVQLPALESLTNSINAKRFILTAKEMVKEYNAKKVN